MWSNEHALSMCVIRAGPPRVVVKTEEQRKDCVCDTGDPGWRKSALGRESWCSPGIHAILFVSHRNQVTHLLVTRSWTSFSPSGALINIPSRSENVPLLFCVKTSNS